MHISIINHKIKIAAYLRIMMNSIVFYYKAIPDSVVSKIS